MCKKRNFIKTKAEKRLSRKNGNCQEFTETDWGKKKPAGNLSKNSSISQSKSAKQNVFNLKLKLTGITGKKLYHRHRHNPL